MQADLLYKILERDIIKSYTSGDFDDSLGQMDMSLSVLNRLYTKDTFKNGDFVKNRVNFLGKIQDIVDRQVFKMMYDLQ